jgi:rhodanese-related sulfurtransferase
MRWTSSPPSQAGFLLALALLCAVIANSLAGPARRLGWGDRPLASAVPPPAPVAIPLPPVAEVLPAQTLPIPLPSQGESPKPKLPSVLERFQPDPAQPIREINREDAWALFRAKVPFLDARRSTDYAAGHIAGAWNISVWEGTVDARITEFEAAAKPGSTTPLVLYCSGGECEDSHLLASRLAPLGYRNLHIYREGYPDWIRQGHPSRQGGQP